ncbi:hypothetical protein F5H01DRAFT_321134 [Linnemannia elongata]|nr:hypothetical protein F5H01DRAFT_321134 [Linnemannia elongata]
MTSTQNTYFEGRDLAQRRNMISCACKESDGLTSALVEDLPVVLKQQMFQMTEDTSVIKIQAKYDELALLLAKHRSHVGPKLQEIQDIDTNFSNAFEVLANKLQDARLAPTARGLMDLERSLLARLRQLHAQKCSHSLPKFLERRSTESPS